MKKDVISLSKKKDKKDKKKKHHKKCKYSSLLSIEQRQKFDDMGVPDMSQDWLEMFTPDMLSDLRTIMRSCSDNQLKSDYVTKELHSYGFEDVGLGTNIVVMAHPMYPGVVFKIALDDYGVADNFNDCILQDVVPKYNRVFARDPSAIISVQERQVLMTPAQRELFTPAILDLLHELKRHFLIADLSPDMYLNYGITRDGDFRIIDGSDLYPLHQLKEEPRCTRMIGESKKHPGKYKYCEGKLKYSPDYKWLVCKECGREYNPLEFRPRKDVEDLHRILSDGLSAEERDELEREEIQAILRARALAGDAPHSHKCSCCAHEDDEVEEPVVVEKPEEVSFEQLTGYSKPTDTRVIIVKPDAVKGNNVSLTRKQSPANGNGTSVSGCVGTINLHGKGKPEYSRESLQSDESELLEAADVDQDGIDDDVDEMPTVLRRREHPVDESPQDAGSDDTDEEDGISLEDAVTRLITSVRALKMSPREEDQEQFRRFINAILEEEFANVDSYEDEEDEDDEVEEDQNPVVANRDDTMLSGDELIAMINTLGLSSSPKDQKIYQELMERFGGDDSLDNDVNTDISYQPEVTEESSEPHITYRVINETDASASGLLTPGIYLDIHGDFDEAYEASGLSIWVTLNGEARADKAIDAYKLNSAIKQCVNDILAEKAMIAAEYGKESSHHPLESGPGSVDDDEY